MKFRQLSFTFLLVLTATAGIGQSQETTGTKKIHYKGKFKIGLEAPLSGDQQTLGEGMLYGAQMAAEEINEAGGIRHKRVIIVPIDDAADADTGVAAAKTALKKGSIKGVVGPYNSGVGIHTLPLYLKKGLLPIRLTSNNSTDGMGYTLQPMSDEIAPVAADAVVTYRQAKAVGIIYDSTQNYTSDLAADLQSRLLDAGVSVTAYMSIEPGASDYSAEVETVAAGNPDVIYAATYFPEGGLIAKAMFEQGVSAKCVADYASDDPGFIAVAGLEAAMAADVVGVPSPREFPKGNDFADAYVDRFGEEPGTWSPYTYDSVHFLADGVETARKHKKKRLKKALDAVVNWEGVTGSVTIDPATGNRVPATLVILGVTADGEFAINKDWAEAVGAPY